MLTPRFHHLHLNSVDPGAAVGWYTRRFKSTRRTTWAGQPALWSPDDVLLVFARVENRPPSPQSWGDQRGLSRRSPVGAAPETAFWHFGWHVEDARAKLE